MTEAKAWWQSKTVWAGVVAVLVAGYNAGAEAFGWPAVPEFVFALLGALGVYGRVQATAVVGGK